jgi:hypothetical protein
MIENEKNILSRRKLLGDMGKLAYVAPTLTLLSVVTNNAHAQVGSPPCPPSDPNCNEGNSPKQKPGTEGRPKKPRG